jgi:hypothetical protein
LANIAILRPHGLTQVHFNRLAWHQPNLCANRASKPSDTGDRPENFLADSHSVGLDPLARNRANLAKHVEFIELAEVRETVERVEFDNPILFAIPPNKRMLLWAGVDA